MIDISILPLFFTAVFFLVISPGPDLILISSYSSTKGFKAGLLIALGIFFAGILQTLLVAFGLA
ncbi:MULTISPECIES: LysE family transporter [unclassified Pseudoalteromonas]|jgi:threonine/homoserine/homoserine lactone efflux protein|uniref:LysE family transporter n=1 Tax=unclassified Pseudoalteromonas TaxID=194690 RepID=UPI0005AB8BA2|nr:MULTISPECIES: LysE family transporter [unclassified Pseudoalteromonas]